MTDLVITRARVVEEYEYIDSIAGEALDEGNYARLATATAKLELGNATTAAEVGNLGGMVTLRDYPVGMTAHVIIDGVLDVGDALDALDFDALVYISDTDGTFTDDADDATVDTPVGSVVPGWAYGATADKLLRFTGKKPS